MVLSVAGVFAVVAVIVVLFFCLKVRKERAQRVSQKLDNTQYEEIDCDLRPLGVIKQACQNNPNIPDRPKTTPDNKLYGGNIVRNAAYESYDSHN